MADFDAIRHALSIARDRGFAEVALEHDDLEFRAVLSGAKSAKSPRASSVPAATEDGEDNGPGFVEITAPLVGYYLPARQPLEKGGMVSAGDIVATITQLGIVNDVEAKVSGEIIEVCVEPNQAVMYGQALARVKESE